MNIFAMQSLIYLYKLHFHKIYRKCATSWHTLYTEINRISHIECEVLVGSLDPEKLLVAHTHVNRSGPAGQKQPPTCQQGHDFCVCSDVHVSYRNIRPLLQPTTRGQSLSSSLTCTWLHTVGRINSFRNLPGGSDHFIILTFYLGGEMGGVARYKQLQLLIEVTAIEVDFPRSNAWWGGNEKLQDEESNEPETQTHIWHSYSSESVSVSGPFRKCCSRNSQLHWSVWAKVKLKA